MIPKINWKVRAKSSTFWMGVVAAGLMFLYELAGLFGLALPFAQEELMRVVQMLLTFLATIGIITDPTTPGLEDSNRALGYLVPGGIGQPPAV